MTNWDSNGASWDSGLYWDGTPPVGNVAPFISLVTSEHISRPDFIAMLQTTLQPFADIIQALLQMPEAFDVDSAVGAQLDTIGLWVGVTRYLQQPLVGVYFSFDTAGIGFDQGSWKGPGDPSYGIVALSDDAYRTLIKAKIVANQWDGTIPGAYAAWNALFASQNLKVLIIDHDDMSMDMALLGPPPDAVTIALFESGEMDLRPAGVKINDYFFSSYWPAPLFGFDLDNSSISGFDIGAWAIRASALIPEIDLTSDSGILLTDDSGNQLTAG